MIQERTENERETLSEETGEKRESEDGREVTI
jgi:hypothetical protein